MTDTDTRHCMPHPPAEALAWLLLAATACIVPAAAAEPPSAMPRMMAAGFVVEPLPLDLPNVNFLRYRADGVLVAGGYDGTVWLLRDTDGDGLEDRADEYFKSPTVKAVLGMDLTPPGDKRGSGVFVAAPGRVVFLPDADGDGRADREIVVASGWPPPKFAAGGVSDTLGVAVGPDGEIWFGIGTDDFNRPYLVDEKGRSRYDVRGERGTIQRVAADFSARTTVCSGIRFPVGMAFNAAGDLFCTDQEGATWLANGNPLDELLWIRPNRHYGFPPRHPRHLPDVIDEPSVFDFRPQHQSTCGLLFNLPAAADRGGPIFGPDWWRDAALVCGESRGWIWRVELEKLTLPDDEAGYVARTQPFACLPMMPIDAAISPRGDLVVTCHSGQPDWGSGPAGRGRLFRFRHARRDVPQPRFAFTPAPGELRIVFDRPLAPDLAAAAPPRIEFGPSLAAGDRFESFRPGYAVVQQQQADPRHALAVTAVRLDDDGRTLVIATDTHRIATSHAVTLAIDDAEVDLGYAPHGVTAEWRDAMGQVRWSGWLPHLDTRLARRFTAGSPQHDRLWTLVEEPGELRLTATVDCRSMLRPAVQRGATLDHEPLPDEAVTLAVTGGLPLRAGAAPAEVAAPRDGPPAATIAGAATVRPCVIRAATGRGFGLSLHWHTAEDPRPRPLPLHRLWMPWAEAEPAAAVVGGTIAADLPAGSWARGWQVFFGAEGNCSTCHMLDGRGGWIGPDLSNLRQRDPLSVRRDIADPNATINPEHIAHVVTLADGRALSGIVRPEGDAILVGDIDGRVTRLARDDVEDMQPAKVSIMPTGIPEKLGPGKMRDLLAFLTTAPRMPDYGKAAPPAARRRSEVTAVIAGAAPPPAAARPLTIVLVAGPKDHGPGEHDYPAWQRAWRELLAAAAGVTVDVADRWPTPEQLATADVLVFYQRGEWTPSRAAGLDAFLARGGGGVFIHWAVDGGQDPAGFAERIGLAWQGGMSRFRHGPLELDFGPGAGHPLARNLDRLTLHDESYWNLVGDPARIRPLARGREEEANHPLVWVREPGRGRLFCSIPGHFAWSFDDPLFRVLLLRGIAWAAGEDVDRFNDLILPGARVGD